MNEQPPKKKTIEDSFRDENVALRIRISSLESDLRLRDQEIAHLRKPRLDRRDPAATDAFRRPLRRR